MKHALAPLAVLFAASLSACGGDSSASPTPSPAPAPLPAHVLLISVDGLHEGDVAHCISANTCPTIAAIAGTGVHYTNASTPGLSDSFPGLAALLTGGTPKTAGLFY